MTTAQDQTAIHAIAQNLNIPHSEIRFSIVDGVRSFVIAADALSDLQCRADALADDNFMIRPSW